MGLCRLGRPLLAFRPSVAEAPRSLWACVEAARVASNGKGQIMTNGKADLYTRVTTRIVEDWKRAFARGSSPLICKWGTPNTPPVASPDRFGTTANPIAASTS